MWVGSFQQVGNHQLFCVEIATIIVFFFVIFLIYKIKLRKQIYSIEVFYLEEKLIRIHYAESDYEKMLVM